MKTNGWFIFNSSPAFHCQISGVLIRRLIAVRCFKNVSAKPCSLKFKAHWKRLRSPPQPLHLITPDRITMALALCMPLATMMTHSRVDIFFAEHKTKQFFVHLLIKRIWSNGISSTGKNLTTTITTTTTFYNGWDDDDKYHVKRHIFYLIHNSKNRQQRFSLRIGCETNKKQTNVHR